jgi:hypothetical protein
MPTTIQITTDNYDGQTAIITFTPDNGGPVVNLGSQVLPYDYNAEYVYGTYSLYFPEFDTTCTLVIENETILMCFQYVGLNFPNPTQLYICNIESDLSTWNGRNYWVLSICVNIPECSYVDVGVVWWDISSSSWIHSMDLGDMGVAFSSLANPGIYPIQVTGVYEWVNLLPGCTCCPSLVDSSLGLCVTVTPTPTITPTMTPTPTPTPTPTKQYYVYKLCGDAKVVYVVQTQPGLTTTPGKVIRTTLDEYCWEFLYQTTNQNPIPSSPLVQIVNWDGDYLTPSLGIIFDNCTDCLSYVTPPPLTTFVLLGPYASAQLACVAANQNGVAGLGFTTFSNNNPAVGSQVYTSSIFGGQQLVTTPGWYSYSASFAAGGIYSTIYIDNTGTITQTGQNCIAVVIP